MTSNERDDVPCGGILLPRLHMSPVGNQVTLTLSEAVETTERARKMAGGALVATGSVRAAPPGLLNVATKFGRDRAGKQLMFFKSKADAAIAADALLQTPLMNRRLPSGG